MSTRIVVPVYSHSRHIKRKFWYLLSSDWLMNIYIKEFQILIIISILSQSIISVSTRIVVPVYSHSCHIKHKFWYLLSSDCLMNVYRIANSYHYFNLISIKHFSVDLDRSSCVFSQPSYKRKFWYVLSSDWLMDERRY